MRFTHLILMFLIISDMFILLIGLYEYTTLKETILLIAIIYLIYQLIIENHFCREYKKVAEKAVETIKEMNNQLKSQ